MKLPVTSKVLLLSLLAVLMAPLSIAQAGNGVERGLIFKVLKSPEMRKYTKELIGDSITKRCSIGRVKSLKANTKIRYQKADRGSLDRFFTVNIELIHSAGRGEEPSSIKVVAAEYDVERPSLPNGEIIAIDSEICR